jgi:pyridoxal phosphate enzyme (YggS family)
MSDFQDIVKSRDDIHARVKAALKSQNRAIESATLVAVSKKQPCERIDAALKAGQRVFGENRVQEAQTRWGARRDEFPDLKLHLIGPLQTNKVKDAVALFDVFETIDREKLARKIADEMAAQNVDKPCFIQVNTGDEGQKTGIHPLAVTDFYNYCRDECGLDIAGLMCIPPFEEPPTPHFMLLRKLAHDLGLSQLSMGMSQDYESALACGATHIRVGRNFFGERSE